MELPPPFSGEVELGKLNVIVGEPDSGKSAFLKYYHLLNWQKDDVFRVVASSLALKEAETRMTSFADALKGVLREAYEYVLLKELLEAGLKEALKGIPEGRPKEAFKRFVNSVKRETDLMYLAPGRYLYTFLRDELFRSRSISEALLTEAANAWEVKSIVDPYMSISNVWMRKDKVRRWVRFGGVHYAHAARSYASFNEFERIVESDRKGIFEVFEKLFGVKFERGELRLSVAVLEDVFYVRGRGVPIGRASGFANSLFHIVAPIAHSAFYGRRPEVLLEEPELYMHPKYQYLMGFALFLIASKLERLTVVTHSIHVFRGVRHASELSKALKEGKDVSDALKKLEELVHDVNYLKNELKAANAKVKVYLFEKFKVKEIDIYDERPLKSVLLPEAVVELNLPEDEGDDEGES